MEEGNVVGLPRPGGTVEDDPLLAVLREQGGGALCASPPPPRSRIRHQYRNSFLLISQEYT